MPSDLIKVIGQYRNCFYEKDRDPSKFRFPTVYPNGENVDLYCFQDEIGFLSWLKWCVDQGEEECLEILGGGFAVSGMKAVDSREAATNAKHAPSRDSKNFCILWAK